MLLEICIAISLMTISLLPLVREPIAFHKAEAKRIARIEGHRIMHWTYTEIQEQLLKGTFRWEQFPQLKEESKVFEMTSVPLTAPLVSKQVFKRSFTFKTLKEKTKDSTISRLIAVHLHVGPCQGTYRVIVEKQLPSLQTE